MKKILNYIKNIFCKKCVETTQNINDPKNEKNCPTIVKQDAESLKQSLAKMKEFKLGARRLESEEREKSLIDKKPVYKNISIEVYEEYCEYRNKTKKLTAIMILKGEFSGRYLTNHIYNLLRGVDLSQKAEFILTTKNRTTSFEKIANTVEKILND